MKDFRLAGARLFKKSIDLLPEQGALAFTRRAFLAGAAGTVTSASVGTAQASSAAFAIEETAAAITVHFFNERCSAPLEFVIPKVYWTARPKVQIPGQRIAPTFTVVDKVAPPQPDGVVRRSATIKIGRARFAGMSAFDVTFEFKLVDQDCTIGLTTEGWPQPGTTRFAPVDFVDFMSRDSPQPQLRYQVLLQIPFSESASAQLAKQLFGDRLRCSPVWRGQQGSLAVGPELSWTLSGPRPDAFSMYPGLAGNTDKDRLGFKSISFAPTTPAKNAQSGSNEQSPFDKEIFSRTLPTPPNADAGGTEAEVSTGISGVSVGPLTGAGGVELGAHGGIKVRARASKATVVGFAQAGDVGKTLSGVLGDFDVVVTGSKGDEGLFLTEGGRIVCYGDRGVTGFARLPILGKPFEVRTDHGRFVIEAADPVIPEPVAEAVKPGIVLSTVNGGDLQSFEISALLRHASIPFPERKQPANQAKAKSGAKPQCPVEPQRPFFSRFDFAGSDCRFVLDSLADPVTPLSARSLVRLGGKVTNSPVQLGLDQATLRVVRPDDLLSLTFRFSGLALSVGETSMIVPLRAGACGVHLAQPVNARLRAGEARSQAFRAGAAVDDRPIMVVEFPPQHVAERAYLRQIDDGEDPPDVALDEETIERHHDDFAVLDRYRKGHKVKLERRIAARISIQCAKQAAAEKAISDARKLVAQAQAQAQQQDPKADEVQKKQKQAADAKAKSEAQNKQKQAEDASEKFKRFCERFDVDSQLEPGSSRWPDDQKIYIGSEWLDLDVRRFARRLAAKIRQENAPQFYHEATKSRSIDPAVREKLPVVDPRDPDFVAWVAAYDRWGERLFGGLPRYCGPDSIQALVDTGQLDNAGLAMLVAKIALDIGSPEDFSSDDPTEARLSGPSRLAFRINCDDFEGGGGAFPFTLADLTNWSRFDLAVVRRAEKLLNFNSAGRLPPRWARGEILDAAATLAHQGIYPGKTWTADPKSASVTAAQRMAEVYASANTHPTPLETAIELPFRLILSPAQDARWRTPMLPPNGEAPTPLWQASLEEDLSRSSLRAVWSEDFQPDVLRDRTSPPPYGPWAPWETPVPQADGGPPHSNTRFRAVMDAGDRHELVTLTSVYGLPVIGRRDKNGNLLADGNQIEPPSGYAIAGLNQGGDAIYSPRTLNVTELALSSLGGSLSLDTHFEPPAGVTLRNQTDPIFQALDVERWRHTAVLGRDISVEVVYKGFLLPLGNRVSFVKLTERRFMRHPRGGPTAYLIQRLFLRVGHPKKDFPALGQANLGRAFPPRIINILTRRTPDLVDPNDRPSIGWADPINPGDAKPIWVHEYANGAVTLSDDGHTRLPGLIFWPRTSSSESGSVRFEVQIDGAGGSISMPMLFVDNTAAHWPDTLTALAAYYNQDALASKRTIFHNGTPRRYATESKAGDATFETIDWVLKLEGGGGATGYVGPTANNNFSFSPPLEGADQPPFYPYLDTCAIRLNQVGKFTGGPAPPATARYFQPYLKDGFAPPDKSNDSEVFLQTVGQKLTDLPLMSFGSSGDRAAGIGRPENRIAALSRGKGPIGGSKPLQPPRSPGDTPAPADPDKFDANFDPSSFNPSNFFGQIGKLLGIIDLGEVIKAVAGLTGMPQLSETIEYASGQAWDAVRQTILQPLNDTLDTLDKTWTTIAVGAAGNAAQRIGKLFPDVTTTEAALRSALNDALAAPAPSVSQQAQLIGNVYEKARAFIGALDRLASDPIGNIEAAFHELVQQLTNVFPAITNAALGRVSDAITAQAAILIGDDTIFNALFTFNEFINTTNFTSDRSKQTLAAIISDLRTSPTAILLTVSSQNSVAQAFSKAFIDKVKAQISSNNQADAKLLNDFAGIAKTDPSFWEGALAAVLGPSLDLLIGGGNAAASAAANLGTSASQQVTVQLVTATRQIIDAASQTMNLPVVAASACSSALTIVSDLLAAIDIGALESEDAVGNLRTCVDGLGPCDPQNLAQDIADRLLAGYSLIYQSTDANASALRIWAQGLCGTIKPPLDKIADQLLELLRRRDQIDTLESQASAECANSTFDSLVALTQILLNRIEARKALFAAAQEVAQAVIVKLRSLPLLTTDNAVKAATAALQLQRILADLFIDPNSFTHAKETVNTLVPGYITDVPSDSTAITRSLDRAIDLMKNLDDPSKLKGVAQTAAAIATQQISDSSLVLATEQNILSRSAAVVAAAIGLTSKFIKAAKAAIPPAVDSLETVMAALEGPLSKVYSFVQDQENNKDIGNVIAPLTKQIDGPLKDLSDTVTNEKRLLASLKTAIEQLDPTIPAQVTATSKSASAVVEGAQKILTAASALGNAISNIGQTALKGQIAQLIDVDAPRREIEALIRDLVPHKATMAYKLDTALTPVDDFFFPDLNRGGGGLTIDTVAVVDLTQGNHAPQTTVKGVLNPVNVHLFGSAFDVVLLKFKQATFGSQPGSNFKFNIDLEDVVLGEMVEFLKALQTYMTPSDGNGFYLRPASGSPGIEVGYGLNLGTISLGPVSFINVSLNAGCRLPFDNSNALFTIGLSRPDSPFLISVGIYGGGGYLGLIANGKTIVGFEASFEFGGVAAFSFGPLTGIGRLTLGIFLRKLYDSTTIDGFFFCGGSARIACFGISASLMVTISQQPGGSMSGQAVFTFSFSVGPAHIDFAITVFKTQSKLGGSASADPLEPPRTRFAELASDLPPTRLAAKLSARPTAPAGSARSPAQAGQCSPQGSPRVYAATMSPNRNWRKYRRYFAHDIRPVGL